MKITLQITLLLSVRPLTATSTESAMLLGPWQVVSPPLRTALPPNLIVLDTACGTGAVTNQTIQAIPSIRIYAADALPPMIRIVKALVEANEEWKSRVLDVSVINGQELRYEDDFSDASIMNFGIFFFPDPVRGRREVCRTLEPGGISIVTLWKELGSAPILQENQKLVKPAKPLESLPLMDVWTKERRLDGPT